MSRRTSFGWILLCLLAPSLLAPPAAFASVVPWMSLDETARQAGIIVLGTVEGTESAWTDDGRMIVTRVTVTVEQSLKGGPRARVIVEVPGGRVGDRTLIASGAPVFSRGERAVLFLEAPRGKALHHSIVGWNLGRYRVRREARTGRDLVDDRTGGTIYVDPQGRPVEGVRQGAGPFELQQFLRQVGRLIAGEGRP